jgi:hypothetical protein
VGVLALSALLVSVPAWLLMKAELSDPDNMLPGIAVMLLAPAVGWIVPLALALAFFWWQGISLTFARAIILGAGAVAVYVILVSIYLTVSGKNPGGFVYFILRLAWAIPSILVASLATALSTWMTSQIPEFETRK